MNKPYVFNYLAPVSPWWENTTPEIAKNSGDLENLLRQARADANALSETVQRLDRELRTAKIDKVVAEKKIEVVSTLIQELSALRRDERAATIEHAGQRTPAAKSQTRKRRAKKRTIAGGLLIVALLVLAGICLFVLAANNGSWTAPSVNHLTAVFEPLVNKLFH